ncbi:MAG TPA: hypothetical protein VNJ29_01545 [Candidatus Nitrosotenuis sp.]|jgi:hypothetical protein|nr:hypothetical protein [Candidatus Nitrosotenuis sp.]
MKMILITFTGLICLVETSIASTLIIKNDDTASVEVVIQPGEGSTIASSPEIRRTIEPGKETTLTLNASDLGGSTVYSITGKVTLPSTRNVCHGLFIDRDYRISFVGTKLGGVACYHEPLQSASPKSSSSK